MSRIEDVKLDTRTVMPSNYPEKVYAGWLGKVIGVRHGGNVEGWTYDRIKKTFGEIEGYIHTFKNFAADDDSNGPIFFIRALEDYTCSQEITSEQIGLTWLNYVPDHHSFFWWGGYGVSTENTAYLNLKNGISAPGSGSIIQNGKDVAEQIGGQIFIDTWGLVAPGDPKLAAEFAEKAASVSHDGNGKYGGKFIAACIAASFNEGNRIIDIIETGLSVIPSDSKYAEVVKDIVHFHSRNEDEWRICFNYIRENYGYNLYPGVCHIIPNTAVVTLSLLYGEGDFSKTINICNMCGWDTDSNLGVIGSIMGVYNGLDGIDMSWRKPVNDFLCCSSVIGSLNILDLPWCASYIANLGYQVMDVEPPVKWKKILREESATYHFEYPGSTHGFQLENDNHNVTGFMTNTEEDAFSGKRSLKVVCDNANGGLAHRVFIKTYYTPDDFNDSRYDPCFSPILYPGQTISCKVKNPVDKDTVQDVNARMFITDRHTSESFYSEHIYVTPDEWVDLHFTIPYMKNVCIEKAGVEFIPIQERHGKTDSLIVYVDDISFSGEPNYKVDFSSEQLEKWNDVHIEVSQLTQLRGLWTLEDGELSGSYFGDPAEAYTGDIKWEDYTYEVMLIPKLGDYHNINFRVQGGIRSYAVGFAPNKVSLYKKDVEYNELESYDFDWQYNRAYNIRVKATGNEFFIYVNNKLIIRYTDDNNPYLKGQIGFSNFLASHTHFKCFSVS